MTVFQDSDHFGSLWWQSFKTAITSAVFDGSAFLKRTLRGRFREYCKVVHSNILPWPRKVPLQHHCDSSLLYTLLDSSLFYSSYSILLSSTRLYSILESLEQAHQTPFSALSITIQPQMCHDCQGMFLLPASLRTRGNSLFLAFVDWAHMLDATQLPVHTCSYTPRMGWGWA